MIAMSEKKGEGRRGKAGKREGIIDTLLKKELVVDVMMSG